MLAHGGEGEMIAGLIRGVLFIVGVAVSLVIVLLMLALRSDRRAKRRGFEIKPVQQQRSEVDAGRGDARNDPGA